MKTVAVLNAKDLDKEAQESLRGFTRIDVSVSSEARDLIKKQSVGLLFARLKTPFSAHEKTLARTLAREAAEHHIRALFLAPTPAAYKWVRHMIGPNPEVEVALNGSEVGSFLKILIGRAPANPKQKSGVRAGASIDPTLDDHPLIKDITSFLRNRESGRLDVRKVAELYKEPLKRFADALGVSPSAITQTPDSKKYQELLGYFENVARIMPMLDSPKAFSTWAKTPNKELQGEPPVEWLFSGKKAAKLAGIVEDVLLGQPD